MKEDSIADFTELIRTVFYYDKELNEICIGKKSDLPINKYLTDEFEEKLKVFLEKKEYEEE